MLCSCFLFIYNYMCIFICSASFQSWLWTNWFRKIQSVKNLGSWEWYVFCKCVASCHSGVLWCVRTAGWISPLCWKVEMECREWQEEGATEMGWEGKDVSSRDAEPASYSHAMIDVETVCWTCPTNLHLYDQWLELHLYFDILMIWLKTWTSWIARNYFLALLM